MLRSRTDPLVWETCRSTWESSDKIKMSMHGQFINNNRSFLNTLLALTLTLFEVSGHSQLFTCGTRHILYFFLCLPVRVWYFWSQHNNWYLETPSCDGKGLKYNQVGVKCIFPKLYLNTNNIHKNLLKMLCANLAIFRWANHLYTSLL